MCLDSCKRLPPASDHLVCSTVFDNLESGKQTIGLELCLVKS